MGAEFIDASRAKIVLNPGAADEAMVKGMNAMTPPGGMERNILTVEEFGRDIDTKITSGGAYADLSFKGNMVKGDTKGQDVIKEWIRSNTRVTAIRFYFDDNDFVALDLAKEPEGFFQVSKFTPGEAPKSGIFTIDMGMIVGGRVSTYLAHKTDDGTQLSFVADSGSGATILCSGSGLIAAGFGDGQTIIVQGSPSNDGSYVAASVAAGVITLTDDYDLTAESGVDATQIHGGA